MKKVTRKKIIVFAIVAVFLGLTATPVINAQMTTNNIKTIASMIKKLSWQTCEDDSAYDLLIITPKEFAVTLQPLVCHKKRVGVSTRLVTLDEVYEQMFWQGRDNAEKIKYFIKEAIENWGIKYVLLVGGMRGQSNSWYLPVRYVHMDNNWEPHYISDLYYADIYDSEDNFSSWDSDGDGIYGEWYSEDNPEDKDIDLYPDIAVGRLPVRNRLEVRIMVNKIIYYETTTYGRPWFKDMIVLAGDTYPEYKNPKWVGYEGEYYADLAIENMTGFNPIKLYTSDGTLKNGRDILKVVSKGCGFLYFVGHGNPMVWSNHLPNSNERIDGFGIFHILLLRNRHTYPICVVSGCHNCQFDVEISKIFNEKTRGRGEYTPECWGWIMTRKIGAGSIVTLGCTALGHTKEDKVSFTGGINELEVQFFKQYGQNNIEVIGDTWAAAIAWYADTYPVMNWDNTSKDSWVDVQVMQSWILFGDPSLKIGGYPLQLE